MMFLKTISTATIIGLAAFSGGIVVAPELAQAVQIESVEQVASSAADAQVA